MKKMILPSILLFVFMAYSCSDDKERFLIPEIPGEGIQGNEFQMVFCPTAENYEITFSLKSAGTKTYINWGDDTKLHEYEPSGEISHTYPPEEGKYIITVKNTRLTALDFTHENALNITAIYLGDCPELMNYSYNKINKLSAFDLRQCPQFRSIWVQVHTTDFDWAGVQNAEYLNIELRKNTNVIDLTNLPNLTRCDIYLDRQEGNMLSTLKLVDVPQLQHLNLMGSSYYPSYYPPQSYINNIVLDAPALEEMSIDYIHISEDVDFSNLGSLRKLIMYGFSSDGDFKITPNLEQLSISNHWGSQIYWNLKSLDLSGLKRLRYLTVEMQQALTHINFGTAESLESLWMQRCNSITKLEFEGLPQLSRIQCFGNTKLASVNASNLPELSILDIEGSPELLNLQVKNTPKIWDVDIANNNFTDKQIKSLFSSLPKKHPDEEVSRRYRITGNPGDIPETHEYIVNSGQWEKNTLYDPVTPNTDVVSRSVDSGINGDIIHLKAK